MRELRVTSWAELQEAVFSGAWNEQLRRHRSPCVFRGVSDTRYSLVTSLARLAGNSRDLERHLLRAFRRYAHPTVSQDSSWYWLSIGQHHGLPTRLLDWSYSPLVAAHFATADTRKFDCDGVIWMANLREANLRLPDPLGQLLARDGTDAFTVELLTEFSRRHARERGEAPTFDVTAIEELERESHEPFLLFFEPPSIDERIVQQYALFSLLSDPDLLLEEWLERHDTIASRIIIPAELKWEVRDKLDQANINERTLFPGLGGLSRWLTRYYTPRGEA